MLQKIARTHIYHRSQDCLHDVKRLLDEGIHSAAKIEEYINKALDKVTKKQKG